MAQSKDPYSNQGDSRDTPGRQKLVALREALLRIHKSLLDMERRSYEKDHGTVTAGELFRLVVDDQQFSWLHNISEFAAGSQKARFASGLLDGKLPCAHAHARDRRR